MVSLRWAILVISTVIRLMSILSCSNAAECPQNIEILQIGTVNKSVEVIRTNQSVVEFYNYHEHGNPLRSGAPDLPLAPRRSVVAVHQNTANCETSLVIVHSKPGEGPFLSYAEMHISGDVTNPLVQDDPPFTQFMLLDEKYGGLYYRIENMTRIQWYWYGLETDGLAKPIVSPDYEGCLKIIPGFTNNAMDANIFFFNLGDDFKFAKIEEWVFASANGTTTNLDLADTLFICFNGADPRNTASQVDWAFPDETINCDPNQPVCDYCEKLTICYWHWWCNIARAINCQQDFISIPQP